MGNRQKSWTSNLRAILAETQNIDSDVKNIVNTILDHENIPRKKPKFSNFVKNIMRNRASPHAIDKTWDLFSQALKPPTPAVPSETPKENEVKKEDVKVEDVNIDENAEETEKKKDKVDSPDSDVEVQKEDENSKKKSKKKLKKEKRKLQEEDNASEETSEKENTEKNF